MAWTIEVENVGGIRSGTELTEGQREGSVTLSTPDETVSVDLVRENGTVTRQGEPFLPSEKTRVAASLYAFLDDRNPVRTAVRNDENLEAVLTRPLEFENIDERVAELTEQREAMQGEESASGRREELSDRKAERETVEQRLTRLERSVDRTREKLAAKRSELEQLEVPETDVDFAARIEQREEKRDRLELVTDLEPGVLADDVACWTCGSTASADSPTTTSGR
jgi:hypothetical protein